jgi:hypothetical protein
MDLPMIAFFSSHASSAHQNRESTEEGRHPSKSTPSTGLGRGRFMNGESRCATSAEEPISLLPVACGRAGMTSRSVFLTGRLLGGVGSPPRAAGDTSPVGVFR